VISITIQFRYNPQEFIHKNAELQLCLEQIRSGYFCPEHPDLFKDIYNSLFYHDKYMLCADFESYCKVQDEVGELYKVWIIFDIYNLFNCIQDQIEWTKMTLRNIASSGKFSSDRTIREYARQIWKVEHK